MGTRSAFNAIRAGVFLACLLLAPVIIERPAHADDGGDHGMDVVRALAAEIWSSRDGGVDAADRRRRLAKAIEARTSVDLLSRLVLGRHWRSLDATDRRAYRALFSDVVVGGLARRLDSLLHELDGSLEQHFVITGSAAAGRKDRLVRSKVIAADGRPLSVDWRLRDVEDRPVIIDLVIEGISLLVSQRNEFAAVIERSRIDGLIEALRQRARSAGF